MTDNNITDKQYVVFKLGDELFGVDINKVKEIIVHQESTALPGTSSLMEGIINLRGRVIPIFNLRKKFGFSEGRLTGTARIVVVEVQDSTIGIVVDGVSEVIQISGEVIEKPSSVISCSVDENYIWGIAKMDEKLVILLELEKIFNVGVCEAV